ncbi:hypothetical protein CEP53_008492 [Fusarium sp. AF-6]|nr:hypothetical protein CEP53_008492 [Fusarium sp. AF-6]
MCIVYRDQDICEKCDHLIYSREVETLCGSDRWGCNKHLLCPKCEEEKKKKKEEEKEEEEEKERS